MKKFTLFKLVLAVVMAVALYGQRMPSAIEITPSFTCPQACRLLQCPDDLTPVCQNGGCVCIG